MGTLLTMSLCGQAYVRKVGGASRDRTGDLLHAMQALSQLSYGPTCCEERNINDRDRHTQAFFCATLATPQMPSRHVAECAHAPALRGLCTSMSHGGRGLRTSRHAVSARRRSLPSPITGDCRYRHNAAARTQASRDVALHLYISVQARHAHRQLSPPPCPDDSEYRGAGGTAAQSAILRGRAEVAESVDAADSKSAALKSVWVRVPPSAPGLTAASAAVCFLRGRRAPVGADHR